MPNPLYNVPGLGGYIGQQEANQQEQTSGLQNALNFQTLQQRMTDFGRQQAFHREMANLPQDQQSMGNYLGLAAKYGSPTDIMHYGGQREAAAARLQQAHQIFMLNYMTRREQLKSLEDKRAFDKNAAIYHMQLQREAAQYNLGSMIPPFQPPSEEAAGPIPQAQRQWTEPTQQQVPPQDREAYNAVLANAKAGIPSSELGQGGPPPQEPQPSGGPSAEPQSMDDQQREMYLLQQRAQAPQGSPTEAPTGPAQAQPAPASGGLQPIPPMPPEVAALPKKLQDQWTIRMSMANALGLQSFSADEKKFWTDRVLAGGDMPTFGFGQQGAADRRAFMKEVAEAGAQKGISGADSLASRAYFRANQTAMASLARLGAQVLSFEGTALRNLKVAIGEAERYARVGVPIIDKYGNIIRENLGDRDIPALRTALITVQNEYTKISSSATAAGVAGTRADREEIGGLLKDKLNIGQLRRVAEVMEKDMNNRRVSIQEEQLRMRREIAGEPAPTPVGPAVTPTPGASKGRLTHAEEQERQQLRKRFGR